MADTPTSVTLGYMSEAALRAVPELAAAYTNAAGIDDTRAGLATRANAVYPKFLREIIVQLNEIAAGRTPVPGLSTGRYWRDGDDRSSATEATPLANAGVPTPQYSWPLYGSLVASAGAVNLTATGGRAVAVPASARNATDAETTMVYGMRCLHGAPYYSAASLTIGATFTIAFVLHVDSWGQDNSGCIIASYRAYDRATETGASYRMGFEVGLGNPAAPTRSDDFALYCRQYSAADAELIATASTGSYPISLPYGREYHVAIQRNGSEVTFFINGILVTSFSVGAVPSVGTAPEMRLVLGGAWDGSKHVDGYLRNVLIWNTAVGTAAIKACYRIGAGYA